MNKLAYVVVVVSSVFMATPQLASATETALEKTQATANDANRGVKKALHRTEEAFCMEGDLKCTSEKVGHRVIEAKNATVDAAKKLKNKVD